MTLLTELSDTLASTVTKASPSIVRVEARRGIPATGIVWSADGIIVTSHHIVQHDEAIKIGLDGGETVSAELVGRDPSTDLAVLRTDAKDLTVPSWAKTDGLSVGHIVLALGRPGKTVQATFGVVSALGDSWVTPSGGRLDRFLQTDVVMYPGFSGGPLMDVSGSIAGLNTSGVLRGISMAVPHGTVKATVETLLKHGRVKRGYLGVGTQPVRLAEALAKQAGQETGLMVVSVQPDSAAEKAGLLQGDVIIAIGGEKMRHVDDLLTYLSGAAVDQKVDAEIVRGGKLRKIAVIIGERG
ncbi:MAG: trypsin-like peptidase domain-containing protein [Chloroflexi bacterium]|nr:trypsin-like peptidase domain-containing protein [Chloroflexota bacterium]